MPAVTPEREPIERLVRGEHHEPHRLLGAHLDGNQVTIRAWRPDATGVVALVGDERVALTQIHPAGVFEEVLARSDIPAYRLEVAYGDRTFTIDDPYRFWPTIGELDQYLLGEGRHERLWQRLGAHEMILDGVAGTAFAVWAPNAARCGWWATSTPGTAACTRCGPSAPPGSGSCSCPRSPPGPGTSTS
jgi:1,4-alpha-glucan branching enzyme